MWTLGWQLWGTFTGKKLYILVRQSEVHELLLAFRATQLRLLNCGFGLKDPTMDIMLDVHVTRLLIGEFQLSPKLSPLDSHKIFVVKVQDAINIVMHINLALPPQMSLDSHENILSSIQSQKTMKLMASHVVFTPATLLPNGLQLSMHSTNPCNATNLHKGSGKVFGLQGLMH